MKSKQKTKLNKLKATFIFVTHSIDMFNKIVLAFTQLSKEMKQIKNKPLTFFQIDPNLNYFQSPLFY